jgi:hypothetical protein
VLRVGLATSAAAALAACTRSSDGTPSPTAPGGPKDPDRALRAEVGADETALAALYAAASAKLSGATATAITELGARHTAYRQAIDPDGLATRPPSETASGSVSSSPSRSAGAVPTPTLPSGASEIVATLRKAEREAASTRSAQALRAVDAELARLIVLAGTGAAGAAQVLVGGAP